MNIIAKDKITYKGKEYDVKQRTYGTKELYIMSDGLTTLNDIKGEYTLTQKYYSKMEFGGATSTVLAMAKNEHGFIVYLELIGQEDMVKSISSVIMQGRMKMNDHYLNYSDGYFQVNKAGNKRRLQQLNDGMAHAIVYHSPSIKDTNFNILISSNKDSLVDTFVNWMDKSNPLPYPKELVPQIFEKMQDKQLLVDLEGFRVEALSVKDDIGLNEYEQLQEIIIDVSLNAGLMNEYVEPEPMFNYALPKSRLLTDGQVLSIYEKLSTLPKTYETDEWPLKPVGVKLFNSSMTLYVTEQDKSAGTIVDGKPEGQIQCFGYVHNESYDDGEWGYINFDDYISLGFEMDLYFNDKYIDGHANIYSLGEIEAEAKALGVEVEKFIKEIGFKRKDVA